MMERAHVWGGPGLAVVPRTQYFLRAVHVLYPLIFTTVQSATEGLNRQPYRELIALTSMSH